VQEFDGYRAAELQALAPEHEPHAALAEQLHHAVSPIEHGPGA